jgi:hypothetical protein
MYTVKVTETNPNKRSLTISKSEILANNIKKDSYTEIPQRPQH